MGINRAGTGRKESMCELDVVVNDILFRSLMLKVVCGKVRVVCELGIIKTCANMQEATAFIEGSRVNSAVLHMLYRQRRTRVGRGRAKPSSSYGQSGKRQPS